MLYYVYFIGAIDPRRESLDAVKIGISNNPLRRVLSMTTDNFNSTVLLASIRCDSESAALALERLYHDQFSESNIRGEWFSVTPELLVEIYSNSRRNFVQIEDVRALVSIGEIGVHLLEVLRQNGGEMAMAALTGVTRRYVGAERNEALDELERQGYIEQVTERTPGRPRRIVRLVL